jgi:hypothetical protein
MEIINASIVNKNSLKAVHWVFYYCYILGGHIAKVHKGMKKDE